jgi:hypothetical protein
MGGGHHLNQVPSGLWHPDAFGSMYPHVMRQKDFLSVV